MVHAVVDATARAYSRVRQKEGEPGPMPSRIASGSLPMVRYAVLHLNSKRRAVPIERLRGRGLPVIGTTTGDTAFQIMRR